MGHRSTEHPATRSTTQRHIFPLTHTAHCTALYPYLYRTQELMYRGLLLTALQQPRLMGPALLGRVDAVFVTGGWGGLAVVGAIRVCSLCQA